MSIWISRQRGGTKIVGGIDASSNPNYPAAVRGDSYYFTVAGKIGGASGVDVEVKDQIVCVVGSSTAGTQAAVGANWIVLQTNIVNPVSGGSIPSIANAIVLYSDTSGLSIKDSVKTIVTTLGADDTTVPTSKAVRDVFSTDGLRIIIDGQGFAIVAGTYFDLPLRFASTITGYTLLNTNRVGATDQISIDLKRCTLAQYASGYASFSSLVAAAPIAMASAGDYLRNDTALTGWTKTLAATDVVRFYVTSCTAMKSCTIIINTIRT